MKTFLDGDDVEVFIDGNSKSHQNDQMSRDGKSIGRAPIRPVDEEYGGKISQIEGSADEQEYFFALLGEKAEDGKEGAGNHRKSKDEKLSG